MALLALTTRTNTTRHRPLMITPLTAKGHPRGGLARRGEGMMTASRVLVGRMGPVWRSRCWKALLVGGMFLLKWGVCISGFPNRVMSV